MLSRVRSSFTYTNVLATIAVFGALGGVSYAATDLTKNSVGPSQIKKNAVNSAEIKNSSLRCKDFKKNQDACGVKTVTRSATVSIPLACQETQPFPGIYQLSCNGSIIARAACKPGERATGGGYLEPPPTGTTPSSSASVAESRPDPPSGSPTAWAAKAVASGFNSGSSPGVAKPADPQVTVYAVCAPA
jgi:hypothetical protein